MYLMVTTKPLNDGTKGFRFKLFGLKGLTRKRKNLSRGYGIHNMNSMLAIHLGKRTVYLETKANKHSVRQFRNWTV